VGAHDRAIDHQPFHVGFTSKSLEHRVQDTHLDPPVIAPLHRVIIAKPLGQISPPPAGARHPQQGIEKTPIVRARSALALAAPGNQRFEPLPLIVPKLIDSRDHDRSPKISLESRFAQKRNPHR
jgi:hypothetical protein